MTKQTQGSKKSALIESLTQNNFLFRRLDHNLLKDSLNSTPLLFEKLYSSRPIYTAFRPNTSLKYLYAIIDGGPIVVRSTPLDRIISITYSGSCFGMRNLPFSFGHVSRAFPSLVEAYKTADVVKIPLEVVEALHDRSEVFRARYGLLFELREKFQYHLLNCSTYPPQAVAALLRALVYQERELGNQPQSDGIFVFDLPVDVIAKACQLNHRTVEQVIKGMNKVGLLKSSKSSEIGSDLIYVVNAEELKEVYGATRDKVSWWPLR
ncbi:Crp/Fnr family transcriptional regulator [Myxosarcina sp. GI1(2024)]